MSRPSLATLQAHTWWHGGTDRLTTIDYRHPKQGGLHLGTLHQAIHRGPVLSAFRLYAGARLRVSRDRGGSWVTRARDARSRGFDALLYLNRWEGLHSLPTLGDWDAVDALSDTAFLRLMPEASYSLLVLRPGVVRLLDLDTTITRAQQEHPPYEHRHMPPSSLGSHR